MNGGSSSIRFALYAATETLERLLHGKVERIGLENSGLTFVDAVGKRHGSGQIPAPHHRSAATFLLDRLGEHEELESVRAVGHRAVHGMARADEMTAAQFHTMVNHESGLLGVSEISSDMRDLLAREADDERAAQAVALFCYQAKKWIGSFVAVLSWEWGMPR